MRLREGHERENVLTGILHHRRKLRPLRSQLIDDNVPLPCGCLRVVLREDRVDQCQHDLALAFAGEGERVANEVHTASLPRRLEDFGHGSFEAQVRIGDDQPNATQSAARQRAQERRPEGLGFADQRQRPGFPYAISVYADGYYYSDRDDSAGLTHLHVRCIDPQVRPIAFNGAIEKRVDALVDLRAQA
jgi:hypothetical protein